MSEAENPTTEREAEKPASSDTGHHLSRRATSALGAPGVAAKKCGACGRKQPAKRTRCTACGATLPEKAEEEGESSDGGDSAGLAAAGAGSPGPGTSVAAPASADVKASAPAADEPKAADKAESRTEPVKSEPVKSETMAETVKAEEKTKIEDTPAVEDKPKTEEPKAAEKPSEPAAAGADEVTLESLLRAAAGGDATADTAETKAAEVKAEPVKAEPVKAEPAKAEPAKAERPETAKTEKAEALSADKPDKPRSVPTPAHGVVKKLVNPTATPAPAAAPARPAAPPVNIGAVVKAEVAPLQKAVDHVGDQIKAGLTLVAKGQRGLEEKTTLVARAIEELAKDAAKRRKDYDALYEEMRQYKINFVDAAQKPLYNELLLLFDSIQRIMHNVEGIADAAIPKEAVTEAFKQVKDELLEVLYRRDIEMIEEHPTKLDVKMQKPVRRVETDVASEDKDVVQCVREGFRRNGKLFRAQDVVVKRCLAVASDEQPIEQDSSETPAGEDKSPAPESEKKEES